MAIATTQVGIVGTGIVARQHLSALKRLNEFTVRAVTDIDHLSAARTAAESGPGTAVARTFEDLLDLVDLVVLNVPHGLHAEMAITAMKAGRHVLVEKPMATTTADCDRMIAAAEEAGVLLWPGQQQRHYPGVLAAKEALDHGELGRPRLYLDRRDGDYRPDRSVRRWHFDKHLAGGGIAMNLGVHIVDRMLWLLGARPLAVQGGWAVPAGYEVESAAFGQVTLAQGPGTSFSLSGVTTSVCHHTTIVCDHGHVVITDDETVVATAGETHRVRIRGDQQYEDSFTNQYRAIARTLHEGAAPSTTPAEGRTAVAVIEALYASAQAGGAPVEIS